MGEDITVTLPAGLWDRLLYAASLGTPMYAQSEEGVKTQVAWILVSDQLEAREAA